MMRSWLTGRRDPFPATHNELTENRTATYRLASELGADAQFAATIHAQWERSCHGGRENVFLYLSRYAAEVTRKFSVLDVAEANDSLTEAFSLVAGREIPEGGTRLISASATLQVEDGHRRFAEQEADLTRQARFHADEAKVRMARLTTIRDMFLHDSASAALWWCEGRPERFLELAAHKDKFSTVVNLLHGTPVDHVEADQASELINVFLADLGPHHREYLLDQLARVFTSYDRPDLAGKLRSDKGCWAKRDLPGELPLYPFSGRQGRSLRRHATPATAANLDPNFADLWGRWRMPIDWQNVCCELSKYTRAPIRMSGESLAGRGLSRSSSRPLCQSITGSRRSGGCRRTARPNSILQTAGKGQGPMA
jgi:hypothetical protein